MSRLSATLKCLLLVSLAGTAGAGAQTSVAVVDEGYFLTHDGLKLRRRQIGSGPNAIVMPLGFILQRDFARLSSSERTLIFYDQRSRGRSESVPPEKLSLQDEVRDMESLRTHFKLQRFTPIGYSYLGLMVAMYAMEYPQHVERLIELGPVPMHFDTEYPPDQRSDDREQVMGKERLAELERLRKAGVHEREPDLFCREQWKITRFALVGDPAHVDALGADFCDLPNEWPLTFMRMWPHRLAEMKRLNFTTAQLSIISQPVLTVHGTKDRNAPYGAGREWAGKLPDARLLTVDGAAHQPWADHPDEVFSAIDEFLRGQWPSAARKVR